MSFYEDICGKTFKEIRDEWERFMAENAELSETELAYCDNDVLYIANVSKGRGD